MNARPTLIRAPGTSLHRQIFFVLRDAIHNSVYLEGAALPTEEELVNQFGVARVTVRRALADLESQGLVERRHGRGTFVRTNGRAAYAGALLGLLDELRLTAQATTVTVLEVETTVPPPRVCATLGIPDSEAAVHAKRLRSAGDTPVMLTDAWVPLRLGRRVTAAALKRRALYEILMDNGVKFGRVVQQISAEAADPTKASFLQCEVSTPLIRLSRLIHGQDGHPVLFITANLSPQRSQIVMDIPGDAINTLSGGHVVHDPALLSKVKAPKRQR